MSNDERKLLQSVMTDEGWPVLEKYLEEYINGLDLKGTVKRNTEFDTIWQRAFSEGGEHHLRDFFKSAELEARKYK